jgi:hypothetical protein
MRWHSFARSANAYFASGSRIMRHESRDKRGRYVAKATNFMTRFPFLRDGNVKRRKYECTVTTDG